MGEVGEVLVGSVGGLAGDLGQTIDAEGAEPMIPLVCMNLGCRSNGKGNVALTPGRRSLRDLHVLRLVLPSVARSYCFR